jgi:putative oxidoreductase
MATSAESRLPARYELSARLLYAAFFLGDALVKILRPERAMEGLSGMGLGYPEVLNYLGAAIEIAGGLCLVAGFRVWAAALLLMLYKLPASFLLHAPIARAHPSHLLFLLWDFAFAGGLILVAGVHRRKDPEGPTLRARRRPRE